MQPPRGDIMFLMRDFSGQENSMGGEAEFLLPSCHNLI